ncbi:MAG: helix-turn-helix transcriptional regulator [Eubacteriales bacterium]|nr:helix-turn-helix transcriptional regulator [Eubacteriales bacterium]
MVIARIVQIINLCFILVYIVGGVYLFILVVRALKKYLSSGEQRSEQKKIKKSLGESLKDHRIRCKMTQEFVAERIGVSRQAVSKWENGTSEPSTTNFIALAKLYGVKAEELLAEISD